MRKRSFGEAMDPVSEMSLGTWGLSGDAYGPVADKVQDEVLDRAVGLGITLVETADVYGRGAMETKLGARLAGEHDVRVVTKIGTDLENQPARKRFDREYLRAACERSADRLRCSRLDGVLLHNPSLQTLEGQEACGALKELKDSGKIRAWGVSAGSASIARAAIAAGAELIQVAYNVFVDTGLESLDIDLEKVGVLGRSVLAHGLLCGQWPMHKVFSQGDHRRDRWTDEQFKGRLKQLTVMSSILGEEISTLRAAALRYALANPKVSTAVLGARSCLQLDQLVREAGRGPTYMAANTETAIRDGLRRMGGRT